MSGRAIRLALVATAALGLTACASAGRDAPFASAVRQPVVTDPAPIVSGTMRPYQIRGRWYRPVEDPDYQEVGLASWYGDAFNGRPTATGEIFDMYGLSAAHKTLPLPGLVEVTNLSNGRSIVVRVNDRGPFVDGRIIDLSRGAADALDMRAAGVAEVRVRYIGPAPRGGGTGTEYAAATPVAPAPRPRPAAAPPVAVAENGSFWVQAGAFSDVDSARRIADRLGATAVVQPTDSGGRLLFRVVVGPWGDANAAEQARLAVVARGYPDALLISGR